MEQSKPFPPPLQELRTRGYLRKITDTEFAVDQLRHRAMTGWGWETLTFSLRLGDLEEIDFEIIQESEYSGDDTLLATNDPEEVEAWITNMIEEKDH